MQRLKVGIANIEIHYPVLEIPIVRIEVPVPAKICAESITEAQKAAAAVVEYLFRVVPGEIDMKEGKCEISEKE